MYKDQPLVSREIEEDRLFPSEEPDTLFSVPDSVHEPEQFPSVSSSNELIDLNETTQHPVTQRKVIKVIIMFDDGTFQEM
jgi:hypothetical protein